jgi:hypothetical protein
MTNIRVMAQLLRVAEKVCASVIEEDSEGKTYIYILCLMYAAETH